MMASAPSVLMPNNAFKASAATTELTVNQPSELSTAMTVVTIMLPLDPNASLPSAIGGMCSRTPVAVSRPWVSAPNAVPRNTPSSACVKLRSMK
mgnify:CR=1 FL=1